MTVDEFRFSLTDGLHVDMGRMEIYIELPTGDSPHLVINQGLQLPAGGLAFCHHNTHLLKHCNRKHTALGFVVSQVAVPRPLPPVFSVLRKNIMAEAGIVDPSCLPRDKQEVAMD